MVPLTHIRKNCRCRVRGSRGRQRRRNEALGFVPGEELTVIQSNQGNLIVCLRGCRYAPIAIRQILFLWRIVMKSLDQVSTGSTVEIVKIHGEGSLRRRILALGVIPGSSLQVVKVALGDPIEVKLNQSNLVIRRSEAQFIEVSGGDHE